MNYNGDEYYEKISSIQQRLHESERQRLELERGLFAYCRSDKRISQIKCSKLRSYLREISDREERAKRRNLDLLRDVEHLENSMKKYQPNNAPLLQQKSDIMNMISKSMDVRKINYPEAESKVSVMQCKGMTFADPGNTPTELGVMGLQTRDGFASGTLDHVLHCSPKSREQIHEHSLSGLLKDSRTGLKNTVSNQAYLSDDISSSNDSPDGCNLRNEHERTTAELPNLCASMLNAKNVPPQSDEPKYSPPVTLTAAEEKPSPCSRSLIEAEIPTVEKTEPKESTTQPTKIEDGTEIPESTTAIKCVVSPGHCESSLSSEVNLGVSKSSALSISLTQSELEEDPSESEATDKRDLIGKNNNDDQYSPNFSLLPEQSDRPVKGVTTESLSQKGLFKLLDTIERQPLPELSRVYNNPSTDEGELNRLIRLCNNEVNLNGEDPKVCGAVVLRELQRLSWSTVKGCLLPPDLVNTHQSCTTADEISGCLLPDAAQLWDRWFKHALLLKEHSVLSTEHLVQLFTPLLLERHATYGHQAKVLLRTLLSRSSEECPSAEDESDVSSFGLAPLPPTGAVRPLQKLYSPELQSSEEDSQDESPVESVPIRESKAYLLLKQSAMQRRILNSKEEENDKEGDLSEINDDHEEDSGWAKRSLHQDPYPRMEEANSKASSALQSKAFWGESDDSNSEIEAALRPQPFNTNNVDTADFYN